MGAAEILIFFVATKSHFYTRRKQHVWNGSDADIRVDKVELLPW